MKRDEKRFVRCKKTGRIFESIHDAANFFGVSHQTICNYCNIDSQKCDRRPEFLVRVEWVTLRKLNNEYKKLRDEVDFLKRSQRFYPAAQSNGATQASQ